MKDSPLGLTCSRDCRVSVERRLPAEYDGLRGGPERLSRPGMPPSNECGPIPRVSDDRRASSSVKPGMESRFAGGEPKLPREPRELRRGGSLR